jgi:hypothetical protein
MPEESAEVSRRDVPPPGDNVVDDWPDDDATDDDWPGEDPPGEERAGGMQLGEEGPGGGAMAGWHGPPPPWPGAPGWQGGWPPPARRSRRRGWVLAAVAAAALVAGAGVTLAVTGNLPFSSSPVAAHSSSPGFGGPGGSGNEQFPGGSTGGGAPPGGAPPGGASTEMFVAGTVKAVSRTSITIGVGGHSVTAAITGTTHITGRVRSAGAIKVGDSVSAQITVRNGKPVATTIRDPAGQLPQGGGLP